MSSGRTPLQPGGTSKSGDPTSAGGRGSWTTATYCRGLNGEVREQDLLGALPLLPWRRDFVRLELPLAEVRDGIDDDPRDAAAKVDKLSLRRQIHSVQ
jgi:hypothetical protein